jgi:hypothetical protein
MGNLYLLDDSLVILVEVFSPARLTLADRLNS